MCTWLPCGILKSFTVSCGGCYNSFGFVMATNLGAVILAMIAQDSATKIGEKQAQRIYRRFHVKALKL